MKKVKKYVCCFKGESSNQTEHSEDVQEPPAPLVPSLLLPQASPEQPLHPLEQTDSSETVGSAYAFSDDYYLNSLFGNYPDYDSSADASPDHEQLPPPQLPNSGVTFPWHEILDGTENFRTRNFLGAGNFGEVYRCDFPRIDMVGAAKTQHLGNPSGHTEFEAEIATLERANHPNVIRILGKCVQPEQRTIVYEFMPRGSLDNHLFPPARPSPILLQDSPGLSWERRMDIAVGVAEALVYVHTELRLVHRDVKIGNVLLDQDFVPKLTDFGLAIPVVEDIDKNEIQSDIYPIKGTPGCMAPELEQSGLVSTKSDVYSYGVFLFQLFTAKKSYDLQRRLETREITDWLTMPIWSREENFYMMIDPMLGNRFSVQGLNSLFQTARMCIDEQANDRPDMGFVESMVRQSAAYAVPAWPVFPKSRSF